MDKIFKKKHNTVSAPEENIPLKPISGDEVKLFLGNAPTVASKGQNSEIQKQCGMPIVVRVVVVMIVGMVVLSVGLGVLAVGLWGCKQVYGTLFVLNQDLLELLHQRLSTLQ